MVGTNCYVVYNENTKECFVVDPAAPSAPLVEFIRTEGLQLQGILLTHGHFDHIGAAAAIKAHTNCEIVIHEEGKRYLEDPRYNLSTAFGDGAMTLQADQYVKDGDVVQVEGTDLKFEVIHAPGHTLDGVAYYNDAHKAAFVGDIIFKGSIGRTDFIGGDMATLIRSIRAGIFTLEREVTLYPGHGDPTTVGFEVLNNPYFNMFE